MTSLSTIGNLHVCLQVFSLTSKDLINQRSNFLVIECVKCYDLNNYVIHSCLAIKSNLYPLFCL